MKKREKKEKKILPKDPVVEAMDKLIKNSDVSRDEKFNKLMQHNLFLQRRHE
ncbi:hypothetical protein [Methylacidiphilum kamchatkense]|uniref:hypothetical protein n=1 Tax=Methylacidiphilum kamchatkense TaxID=431057 RepID=UPI000B0EBAE7|nr:hypothetical protein [Methylacidiphilum kamchatkense]